MMENARHIMIDEIPIHVTQPWISVTILNLSEISPSTSSFRARLEYNVFWHLSDDDSTSYITSIQNKTIRTWDPTWAPNFIPVNVSCVHSMTREVFSTNKNFIIIQQKGSLVGTYTLILDATFTELFELRLFPFDVQDFAMDMQYHSQPQAFRPLLQGSGDVDLTKSTIKIHEKCLSSPEWIFHSVLMGFGASKEQVRINVKLVRRWQCYVLRVVKVLGLITLISSFVPFIPSNILSGQLGILVTCILSAIAYLHVVGSCIPKLPYSTCLDGYIGSCITFIGYAMIKASILSFLKVATEGEKQEALIVFAVDIIIWIGLHLFYIYISVEAMKESEKNLWTFPEPRVFNESARMGDKPTPVGCVAILDSTGRRDDLEVEVYQKLLPTAYADIIYSK